MIDFPYSLDYTFPMIARLSSYAVIGPAGAMEEVNTARGLLATDSMDKREEAIHDSRLRVQFVE